WHIKLAPIQSEENRQRLLGLVDSMTPGDMPDFDPHLKLAHDALIEPARGLATKHVIIISDGDPQLNNPGRLTQMKQDKVTVTTVGVATPGAAQDQALKTISDATAGRFHSVTDPSQLPAIYIKEIRLVSRSFVAENKNGYKLRLLSKSGPTEDLPDELPLVY